MMRSEEIWKLIGFNQFINLVESKRREKNGLKPLFYVYKQIELDWPWKLTLHDNKIS